MTRAKAQDFLHSFRFHVEVTGFGKAGDDVLGSVPAAGGPPTAGFTACTMPELSQEAVEYREGHMIYTQKYCGLPTVGDVTLSRGVALAESTFWTWVHDVVEGSAEYRADLKIYHMHRDAKPVTTSISETNIGIGNTSTGNITYVCFNAFPTRYKAAGDLDATASEVSIQELDLAVEYITRTVNLAPTT